MPVGGPNPTPIDTQGKRIGRPSIAPKLRQQIAERIGAGETPYAVAKALGIDWHTAAKYG